MLHIRHILEALEAHHQETWGQIFRVIWLLIVTATGLLINIVYLIDILGSLGLI